MPNDQILGIRPVPPQITVDAEKATVTKLLEEAAEVFAAWQWSAGEEDTKNQVLFELADVVQCVSSIASMLGITDAEMRRAIMDTEQRNAERGRY